MRQRDIASIEEHEAKFPGLDRRGVWTVNKFPLELKNQFSSIARLKNMTIPELLEQIVSEYIEQHINAIIR